MYLSIYLQHCVMFSFLLWYLEIQQKFWMYSPASPKLVVDLEWHDIFDRFVVLWLCILETLSNSPVVTKSDFGLLGNEVLPFSLNTEASWYPELSELFLEWQIVKPFSGFLTCNSVASEILLEGFSSDCLRASSIFVLLFPDWDRDSSDTFRVSSDTLRISADGLRVSSDVLRVSSDGLRISSDGLRDSSEIRRISSEFPPLSSSCWSVGGFGAGLRFRCGGLGRSGGGGSFFGDIMIFCWIAGGVTDLESSLCVGEIDRLSLEIDPDPILYRKILRF